MKLEFMDKIENVLAKEIKGKSLVEVLKGIDTRTTQAFKFTKEEWTDFKLDEKIKFFMLLGLGRDRTIACLSEHKINREHIKKTRENMSEEETEFRLESEKFITRKKIDSSNRAKRLQYFKEINIDWEDFSKRYLEGESLNKLTKEYNAKVNYITEQLKDDGIHDESRSTLLKNKKAKELENVIDDNFIIELVKNNPLDSKDVWWEKAKERYPWLLRKQMFEKLLELGLERSAEEVNLLRSIRNKESLSDSNMEKRIKKQNNKKEKIKKDTSRKSNNRKKNGVLLLTLNLERPFTNNALKRIAKNNSSVGARSLSKIVKKEFPHIRIKEIEKKIQELQLGNKNIISAQLIKANTMEKIHEIFGSLENLVYLYMENSLGSYSKIAKKINENYKHNKTHIEVSTRQVEKAITRHPSYVPRQSYPEKQLLEYVTSTFPNFTVTREKQIPGTMKRMDVFIEELKVGLEFNGDYYHSDEVVFANYKKTAESHHKERAEDAAKHGIKLVYVWERDWNNNYGEIEKAIVNQDWDNPILNRHSNSDYHRKVKPPKAQNSNSRNKNVH